MASELAFYWPGDQVGVGENPFGLQVANAGLIRALIRHGGFDRVEVLMNNPAPVDGLAGRRPDGAPAGARVAADSVLNVWTAARAGTLMRGSADLADLAWLRRGVAGDSAYSLVGLVHTIAPFGIRNEIADAGIAPVQPWDALICTSPAVQAGLTGLFDEWGDHLAERMGSAAPPPPPLLPVIPLGVDLPAIAAQADRPAVRAAVRAELGVAPDEVLVLWVGRLSFTEKAFPQPMFRAVAEAARATGRRLHLAMAGWFHTGEAGRRQYAQAARAYAPDTPVHFLDGNDPERIGGLWAAADVFLSLVDNIQETFGITPLEAMAAGLPVVASDWDGYRATVRHGREGFLIPTLIGPPDRLGPSMAARYGLRMDSYYGYAGAVAQHTAVHVGRAAEALAALVRAPELRARMGAAGRARVAGSFDWPVVAPQIAALADELSAIRSRAGPTRPSGRLHPAKGDPFRAFAHFATTVLSPDTALSLREGIDESDLARTAAVELDAAFGHWRAAPAECAEILALVGARPSGTLRTLTAAFPEGRRRYVELAVVWLAKLGLLEWSAPPA